MKNKLIKLLFDIGLRLLLWIVITTVVRFTSCIYYKYAPINNFIEFQWIDFQDYNKWDTTQIIYSYRDTKRDIMSDITHKFYCNWRTAAERSILSKHVLLNKTNWLEKIIVNKPTIVLPKWNCTVYSHLDIDINWAAREINLSDDFIIN